MDAFAVIALIGIVGAVIWVGLSIAVGRLGEQRGSSGLLWFLLAIVTSPLVALILLLLVIPRDGPRRPV